MSPAALPPCPITGEPPRRHIQSVDVDFLCGLWKFEFGAEARASFGDARTVDLYESPTGLHYFWPPFPGDHTFYAGFYKTLGPKRFPRAGVPRPEFVLAARVVRPNDRVLDVGCGFAGFKAVVPEARYFGLDPNFAERAVDWASGESLEQHVTTHEGQYDVACAFQVIEHLADPLAEVQRMARVVRAGGHVAIGVPHVPSAMTRIPNFLVNAPPHHLTWWTREALRALAARTGLEVVSVEQVPWGPLDAEIYWIERSLRVRTTDKYFEHSWASHAAVLAAFTIGPTLARLRGVPKDARDEGAALLLIARKG